MGCDDFIISSMNNYFPRYSLFVMWCVLRLWIIIPTYNERDNIIRLLEGLKRVLSGISGLEFRVLVVDDNSPDGTADVVRKYIESGNGFVVLIVRRGRRGLGSAVRDGMRYILENDPGVEYIATMDADLSHRPEDLPILLEAAERADLVQGSRYVRGGGALDWGFHRRLISWSANLLIRILYRTGIRDHTGNYKVYSRRLAEDIVKYSRANGFEIAIETVLIARALGYRVVEAPIIFINRVGGRSKLTIGEIIRWLIYIIGFRGRFKELRKASRGLR